MSEAELARTLAIAPDRLADFARTIVQSPTSTIEPASHRADSLGRRALAGLGEQTAARDITGGLEIDRTIGEGGMGIVRLATQRSLGRQVAVKTLRPNTRTEDATLRLLREAWVTGSLEHPNIVPVYDLGIDADGSPIIILKRIEGVEWATLIADADVVQARFGASDLLEYNLRILIQLCNAVSLAHARKVLHRDLKPENVMIGRFGEVYLVDWGIAVSLDPDPTGRLPLASDANEMAGTPAYMAPEMLGAMGRLSERTDVYLLGAILHEILTGAPPHRGANFREMAVSILLSSFEYPESVPRELADIASKAMSREAAARFASADELRIRLESYLRHRGSLALSDEAARRLVEMRALASGADDEDARARLYQLAAEARFGFRQAILAYEHNEVARVGLRETIESMVTFELERGTPEGAAAALAELDAPAPELAARVRDALAKREADKKRVAELERIGAELDPSVGRRTRMFVTAMLGVVWTVAPEVLAILHRERPEASPRIMFAFTIAVAGFGAGAVWWGRESLSKTAVNRRIIATGMILFATQLLLELGGMLLGLPLATTLVLHLFVWSVMMVIATVFVERKLWPTMIVMMAAFLYAAANPAHVWHAMSSADFVLLINVLLAWSNYGEDREYTMRVRAERAAKRGRAK